MIKVEGEGVNTPQIYDQVKASLRGEHLRRVLSDETILSRALENLGTEDSSPTEE